MNDAEIVIVEPSEDSAMSDTQSVEQTETTEVIEENEELESVDSMEVGENTQIVETLIVTSGEAAQHDYSVQFNIVILLLFFILAFTWIRSVIK